jgi:hypothetical protein
MKTVGMTIVLVLLLITAVRNCSAGLLADSDFNASRDSADLRGNSAGQDWYESRQDVPTLVTLDSTDVGGNATKKARLTASTVGSASLTQEFSAPQTQQFAAQWDIYVDSILDRPDSTYDRAVWMFIGDDTGTTPDRTGPNAEDSERFVYLGFYKAGGGTSGAMDLVARESSATAVTFTTVATGLSLKQWYAIRVVCDLARDTYEVYLDGQLQGTVKARTPKSSVTHISFAEWTQDEGAATFYVDNVTAESSAGQEGEIVIVDEAWGGGGIIACELSIPDGGQWARSWTITSAPPEARVTSVSYWITVVDPWDVTGVAFSCSDWEIGLSSTARGGTGDYFLVWDNAGDSHCHSIDLSSSTDVFNGQPVNQTWFFRLKDTVTNQKGACWRQLKLVVHYEVPSGDGDEPANEYIVVAQLNLWYHGPGCYGGFEAFNCNGKRNTNLIPYLGFTYDSADPRVLLQQINWAADYGVDAFSLEWTTPREIPGSLEVNIDDAFLQARNLNRIRWCIFYDFVLRLLQTPGLNVDLSGGINFDDRRVYDLFVSDFGHLAGKYFDHPQHLRIDERPVIYVWPATAFTGNVAGAVRDARAAAAAFGHDVFITGELVRADAFFDPGLVSLFDASAVFTPFFMPGLDATKWADVGEAAVGVDQIFTDWRWLIQGLQVAGRPNDYVTFQSAWAPQYDDRLVKEVNNESAGCWIPARSKQQVIALAEVARKHAQPAGNSGQKIVWLNTFNCWAETTTVEPTAASGSKYPAGNYQFDMLEVVREVFGDETYGTQ